jgi:hypothetical protein
MRIKNIDDIVIFACQLWPKYDFNADLYLLQRKIWRDKNSYFVFFVLNKILYFHSQVNKFQNDIYFICNCVNSVNRDDM